MSGFALVRAEYHYVAPVGTWFQVRRSDDVVVLDFIAAENRANVLARIMNVNGRDKLAGRPGWDESGMGIDRSQSEVIESALKPPYVGPRRKEDEETWERVYGR